MAFTTYGNLKLRSFALLEQNVLSMKILRLSSDVIGGYDVIENMLVFTFFPRPFTGETLGTSFLFIHSRSRSHRSFLASEALAREKSASGGTGLD